MKEIATTSTTKYILDKYNLNALKKYGQNFLIDTNVVEKIVASANIDENCAVIEIGPGIGALTQILSKYAGLVQSYEIDERFKPVYEEFLDKNNINIIFNDFMDIDLDSISHLKKQYQRIILVSNLPYYITTNIIEKVIRSNSVIDEMIVMVQKEVALKFTSDYKSPLTLIINDMGSIEYLFTVSKNVFIPAPHVDSAIMKISLNKPIDKKLYQVLKVCFTQRRKTIYNNLKTSYSNSEEILNSSNIELNKRSEQLELEDFKTITKNIK